MHVLGVHSPQFDLGNSLYISNGFIRPLLPLIPSGVFFAAYQKFTSPAPQKKTGSLFLRNMIKFHNSLGGT
jgi:hypothetical protein